MDDALIPRTPSCAAIDDNRLLGSDPRRRRVLFVNADADLRAVVTRVLQRESYEVCAVAHSGHALLMSRRGAFDVLITELSGPDVSGPALFDVLRRHCPGMTPLYLAHAGTPEGINRVLVRPFTRDDLLLRLEFMLSVAA